MQDNIERSRAAQKQLSDEEFIAEFEAFDEELEIGLAQPGVGTDKGGAWT